MLHDEYDDIRKEAIKRVKIRQKARRDALGILLIDGFLWLLFLIAGMIGLNPRYVGAIFLGLIVVSLIIGALALAKWYTVAYAEPRRERRFQDEVEQEVERELGKRGLTEKRKRLALSDDGELVEVTDDLERAVWFGAFQK